MDTKGLHALVRHGGSNIILGGQGVAAGQMDLRAALPQHQTQVGGLGLQMDGDGDGQSGKGLFPAETLLDTAQGGHKITDPLDLLVTGGGQRDVFDDAHIE